MADTIITDLTAAGAVDPANDAIPIVDVSDSTHAASGTTKKVDPSTLIQATDATRASSAFGTDNRLIKSDGTGRLEQATGITVDDSNNVSGVGTLMCGSIATSGTVDGVDVAAHESATAAHGATGAVVGTTNTQTLTNKTLTAPVISSVSNSGTVTLPTGTQTLVARDTTDTLTNKTLTTPTIGSFTNATHSHTNAAGGGTLSATAIASGTMATARLGSGTASSSTFLRGDQTWATPPGGLVTSKSFTRKEPTDSDDISLFFVNENTTLDEIRCVLIGSSTPSVTWTIRWNSDRSATGTEAVTGGTTTTSTSTGSDITSFDETEIPADSFVWFETTAQSGTVDELHLTIFLS